MRVLNHILMGFSGGLGLSGIPAALEMPVSLPMRVAFAVGSAGAAALPDIDSPKSTVAHAGGRPMKDVARGIDRAAARLYAKTKTARDPTRRDGHRGITHTLAAAIVSGMVAGFLGWLGGGPAIALVLFVLGALARRGTFGRARRRGSARVIMPPILLLTVLLIVSALFPAGTGGGLLLGLAVATGMLIHNCGDIPTDSGVPLFWPLPIRGQRWFRVRLPQRWALKTGGAAEYPLGVLFTLTALLQLAALAP